MRFLRVPVATVALLALAVPVAPAAAAPPATTLVFREPHEGATSRFVDVSPKNEPGAPFRFSPGDQFIFTNPLESEGRRVGRIRVVCAATHRAGGGNPVKAGFLCVILARVRGGSLAMTSPLSERGNPNGRKGAVIGGTGKYAGARGTFDDEGGRSFDTDTITLLE